MGHATDIPSHEYGVCREPLISLDDCVLISEVSIIVVVMLSQFLVFLGYFHSRVPCFEFFSASFLFLYVVYIH